MSTTVRRSTTSPRTVKPNARSVQTHGKWVDLMNYWEQFSPSEIETITNELGEMTSTAEIARKLNRLNQER